MTLYPTSADDNRKRSFLLSESNTGLAYFMTSVSGARMLLSTNYSETTQVPVKSTLIARMLTNEVHIFCDEQGGKVAPNESRCCLRNKRNVATKVLLWWQAAEMNILCTVTNVGSNNYHCHLTKMISLLHLLYRDRSVHIALSGSGIRTHFLGLRNHFIQLVLLQASNLDHHLYTNAHI